VVCDDTDDFIGNIVPHAIHAILANERGEHYELPPELTEDEQLQVAVIVSAEEEKRAFSGLEDALVLSVAPSPPPGLPSHTTPRRAASNEVWDVWPVVETLALPAPARRPPPPPMVVWPWPQGPFIDLSD
jgi:hypothetical protein